MTVVIKPSVSPETDIGAPPTSRGPIARSVAASVAAGLGTALALALMVFPGAAESTITGSMLVGFGLGWALMGLQEIEDRTEQPVERRERQRGLRLQPLGAKHLHITHRGQGLRQESRLPHARLPMHDDAAGRPVACGIDERDQAGQLDVSPMQHFVTVPRPVSQELGFGAALPILGSTRPSTWTGTVTGVEAIQSAACGWGLSDADSLACQRSLPA